MPYSFQSSPRFHPIVRSDKIRLYDKDGNWFQDGISGIFNVNYGYSSKRIISAVTRQVEQLCFLGKEYLCYDGVENLCHRLVGMSGLDCGAALMVSGGSEAIEAALVLAYEYHKRNGEFERKKIFSRVDSYHGATLGAKSITGRMNVPRIDGAGYEVVFFPPPVDTRYPGGNNCASWKPGTVQNLDKLINQIGPETVSALVVEPVNHLRGMWPSPPNYLSDIAKFCKKYGILLILDEIITGFGRTGTTFAFQEEGIEPDLICLGKGMSGGYAPVAAVIVGQKIVNVFRDGPQGTPRILHGHTYAGNPIGVAASTAALEELEMLKSTGMLFKKEGYFLENMNALRDELSAFIAMNVNLKGMLCGLQFLDAPEGIGKLIVNECFHRNLIVRGEEDWVALAPAFVSDHNDLDFLTEVLGDAIKVVVSRLAIS